MPNKKILIIGLVIILLIVLGFILSAGKGETPTIKDNESNTLEKNEEETSSSTPEIIGDKQNNSTPQNSAETTTKDNAWKIFNTYLGYTKDQDLEKLRSVVYKLAPICDNPETIEECKIRMTNAYTFGSKFEKQEFVNVFADSKQIILSTNPIIKIDDISVGYFRKIIYFTVDSGTIKLLRFYPSKGIFLPRNGDQSIEELGEAALNALFDGDKDGLSDFVEICAGKDDTCIKTDPKVRDTDGNGFWDGTDAQFEIE